MTTMALIWGQCSDVVMAQIKALDTYNTMRQGSQGFALLIVI